ncbi:hypothetical protein RXV95_10810 [Novosphingobium sp. ZN18A2]|uniref:hypothetical protein n=1 Tax=Novosphingobium sp. ZN18A2 TaxID=3079861 RepID=UPI0030D5FB6B
MMQSAYPTAGTESIDALLRDELAASLQVAENNAVILRHLLRSDDHSVFSDEVIARVRGMVADVARQLVIALARAAGYDDAHGWAEEAAPELAVALAGNQALIAHFHALALEYQLTCRLERERSIDPVLSPLLQAQVASALPEVATVAMHFLTAQARFCQTQRRMEMPLAELPGDFFHAAMLTMRAQAGQDPAMDECAASAEETLRAEHENHAARVDLAAGLLGEMGNNAAAALSIEDAGVALFLSALALGAGQDRDAAMMSTTDGQMGRLVLALAACGLKRDALVTQFAAIHPDVELPEGLEALHADRAAALLGQSAGTAGH